MNDMDKGDLAVRSRGQANRTQTGRSKRRAKTAGPKTSTASDRRGTAERIDQIREEIAFHRDRAAALKAEQEELMNPASDGRQKILVVDDDPTTLKIISHFLQKENYRVSTSLSGVGGLKKAFKENPDLIILDIMMPDLNGFQFLSIYRKDEENAQTPVVILSSLSEETDMLKGLGIGAIDYVTKPFSPQVLMAKIKKAIRSET
jgi:PleD family two-component response regulator